MCARRFNRTILPATLLLAALGGCGGNDSNAAASQAEQERVIACDLITTAEAESLLGVAAAEPDSYESDTASVCTFVGANDAVTLRVWHPFHGGGSSPAEWVSRLKEERAEAMESESDPDLKRALAEVRIVPYDRLGVTAAREDIFDQIALHALKGGSGGVYLSVYASGLDLAHGAAEAALAKIR